MRVYLPLLRILGGLALVAVVGLFYRGFYEQMAWQRYLTEFAAPAVATDAQSPTGLAGGLRRALGPRGAEQTQEWVAQTQQGLRTGEWSLSQVEYDNAPKGRPTSFDPVYRRYLGLLSRAAGAVHAVPPLSAVETVVGWADVVLLGAFLLWILGWGVGQRRWEWAAAASLTVLALWPFAYGSEWVANRVPWFWTCLALVAALPLFGYALRVRGDAPSASRPRWVALGLGLACLIAVTVWLCLPVPKELILSNQGVVWARVLGVVLPALVYAAGPLLVERHKIAGAAFFGLAVLGALPAATKWAKLPERASGVLSNDEAAVLVERDLSWWLAQRVGDAGAVVLAPASLSQSLWYHGGQKVIASENRENKEGFLSAVRLSAASSADEAKALLEGRGVTHVILPSWDAGMEEFARLGAADPTQGFVQLLRSFNAPRWLRPTPYELPQLSGWEQQDVIVYEVVELEDNATALAHLFEYFLQTNRPREALAVSKTLAISFPEELISLMAQLQAARLQRDATKGQKLLVEVVNQLEAGNDEILAWADRISLSLLLAELKRADLAGPRLQTLLSEPEDQALRKLSTRTLFRLLKVTAGLKTPWASTEQAQRARSWLPSEYRDQL